jgi:sugar lactone lactonase YvrE
VRTHLPTALLLALACLLTGGTAAGYAADDGRARWHTEMFSRVPPPGFPAHVYAHPNGRVYAGTYTDPTGDTTRSRVFEWSRDGALLRSWTVPGQRLDEPHGVQVATSDGQGRLVLLEKSTSRVLLLDPRTGELRRYARLPDVPTCSSAAPGTRCSPSLLDKPAIPNFAAWGPDGSLYVTDYGQAVLWRIPPGSHRPRVWLADRRLDGVEFGTTGLLLEPGHRSLLVGQGSSGGLGEPNPTSGKLYRVPIRRDGRPGDVRLLWESRPGDLPDGFGIARSGNIYVAAAGLSQQVVVLGPDGEEVGRFPQVPAAGDDGSSIPFDTPSSATFLGRRILVANQAYTGNRDHHAVLDVHVGEPGAPVFVPDDAGDRVSR